MRLKKDLEQLHQAGPVRFGYVDITVFECPPFVMFTNGSDCGICDRQLMGEVYEPHSTFLWAGLVSLATSVFDIGTRCGEYSLIAAALRDDIPIISCEPNPDGFARLQVNMLANDVRNMHIHRVAISNESAIYAFGWVPKGPGHISSGGRVLKNWQSAWPEGSVQLAVQAEPLDKLTKGLDLGAKPIMKIDVEGAEQAVFQGMPSLLARKPDIILETFSPQACDYITAVTQPLGYNYYFIDEDRLLVTQREKLIPAIIEPAGCGRKSSFNQLLTTRTPAAIAGLAARNS